MNPVAFELFGISVRWYGILIALALFLATIIMQKRAKKLGIKEDIAVDMVLVCMPVAIVGARLYYVIFNYSYYQGDFIKMINIRQGGLAIHGGVISGLIAGYIFTRIKKLDFWQLADIAAPALVLGQAIGRWGNYFNSEAHGGATDLPWGIMVNGVKVHPTFFYEFISNLIVFGILIYFRDKKKFQGEIFALYAVLYSIGRFFIEGLRTDSLMLGPLRVAQVVSLVAIVFGCGFIFIMRKKSLKRL